MRILYFAEYNIGGGAKANLNLALSSAEFAEVSYLGIGLNKQEFNTIDIIKTKARKPISLKYFFDFWRSLNYVDPQIVHATGMFTGLAALLARSLRSKKFKIIITLHHTSTKFRFGFIAKKLIPVLNKADVIHYLTEYQRQKYIMLGLKPEHFRIIPNIIHTYSYNKDDVSNLRKKLLADTSSGYLLVSVGRLVESKQPKVFIETVRIMNQNGINTGGIILGTGDKPYVEKIKRYAVEIEISSKILFTGFSSQPELYIKACDICLFPTLHEALPLFILESFSQHKTIVVSNHPSITGIVSDNLDSVVVYRHTAEEYAKKCIELIKKPQILNKLEKGAGNTYNKYYKADKVIKEFKKMYFEILNARDCY